MNAVTAQLFLKGQKVMIEVEGMAAENYQRDQCNEAIAYDECQFIYKAEEMQDIINELSFVSN